LVQSLVFFPAAFKLLPQADSFLRRFALVALQNRVTLLNFVAELVQKEFELGVLVVEFSHFMLEALHFALRLVLSSLQLAVLVLHNLQVLLTLSVERFLRLVARAQTLFERLRENLHLLLFFISHSIGELPHLLLKVHLALRQQLIQAFVVEC